MTMEVIDAVAERRKLKAVDLHTCTRQGLSLAEALEQAGTILGDRVAALLANADTHQVLAYAAGAWQAADGDVPWDAWSLRCFSAVGELRWRQPIGTRSRTVLLLDQATPKLPGWSGWTTRPRLALEQRTLVWGSATASSSDGWTSLFEARVGTVAVPVEGVQQGGRVQLRNREYLGEVKDADGTIAVLEERLVGFSPAKEA